MRLLQIAIIGSVLCITTGGTIAMGRGAVPTLPAPDSGFDWNRFYVGAHATGLSDSTAGYGGSLGVDVGLNARIEVVLAGGELSVDGVSTGAGAGVRVAGMARAGLMLSDTMAVYGAGGLSVPLSGSGGPQMLVGGGVETALADSFSIDARYLHGSWPDSSNTSDRLTIGTNVHF